MPGPPPNLPPIPGAPAPASADPAESVTPEAPTPEPPSLEAPAPEAPAPEAAPEPEIPTELTYAIVRAMVAASLADGRLDEREKSLVLERIESSDLPLEHKQQVHRDLVLPPTPAELAGMVSEPAEREAVYRLAGLVVLADGEISDLERGFLDRLAGAFELDADHKTSLEAEIFA
ncbi:MAG: DUF533 domain-containing protein [Acidobacteriota bacterium]